MASFSSKPADSNSLSLLSKSPPWAYCSEWRRFKTLNKKKNFYTETLAPPQTTQSTLTLASKFFQAIVTSIPVPSKSRISYSGNEIFPTHFPCPQRYANSFYTSVIAPFYTKYSHGKDIRFLQATPRFTSFDSEEKQGNELAIDEKGMPDGSSLFIHMIHLPSPGLLSEKEWQIFLFNLAEGLWSIQKTAIPSLLSTLETIIKKGPRAIADWIIEAGGAEPGKNHIWAIFFHCCLYLHANGKKELLSCLYPVAALLPRSGKGQTERIEELFLSNSTFETLLPLFQLTAFFHLFTGKSSLWGSKNERTMRYKIDGSHYHIPALTLEAVASLNNLERKNSFVFDKFYADYVSFEEVEKKVFGRLDQFSLDYDKLFLAAQQLINTLPTAAIDLFYLLSKNEGYSSLAASNEWLFFFSEEGIDNFTENEQAWERLKSLHAAAPKTFSSELKALITLVRICLDDGNYLVAGKFLQKILMAKNSSFLDHSSKYVTVLDWLLAILQHPDSSKFFLFQPKAAETILLILRKNLSESKEKNRLIKILLSIDSLKTASGKSYEELFHKLSSVPFFDMRYLFERKLFHLIFTQKKEKPTADELELFHFALKNFTSFIIDSPKLKDRLLSKKEAVGSTLKELYRSLLEENNQLELSLLNFLTWSIKNEFLKKSAFSYLLLSYQKIEAPEKIKRWASLLLYLLNSSSEQNALKRELHLILTSLADKIKDTLPHQFDQLIASLQKNKIPTLHAFYWNISKENFLAAHNELEQLCAKSYVTVPAEQKQLFLTLLSAITNRVTSSAEIALRLIELPYFPQLFSEQQQLEIINQLMGKASSIASSSPKALTERGLQLLFSDAIDRQTGLHFLLSFPNFENLSAEKITFIIEKYLSSIMENEDADASVDFLLKKIASSLSTIRGDDEKIKKLLLPLLPKIACRLETLPAKELPFYFFYFEQIYLQGALTDALWKKIVCEIDPCSLNLKEEMDLFFSFLCSKEELIAHDGALRKLAPFISNQNYSDRAIDFLEKINPPLNHALWKQALNRLIETKQFTKAFELTDKIGIIARISSVNHLNFFKKFLLLSTEKLQLATIVIFESFLDSPQKREKSIEALKEIFCNFSLKLIAKEKTPLPIWLCWLEVRLKLVINHLKTKKLVEAQQSLLNAIFFQLAPTKTRMSRENLFCIWDLQNELNLPYTEESDFFTDQLIDTEGFLNLKFTEEDSPILIRLLRKQRETSSPNDISNLIKIINDMGQQSCSLHLMKQFFELVSAFKSSKIALHSIIFLKEKLIKKICVTGEIEKVMDKMEKVIETDFLIEMEKEEVKKIALRLEQIFKCVYTYLRPEEQKEILERAGILAAKFFAFTLNKFINNDINSAKKFLHGIKLTSTPTAIYGPIAILLKRINPQIIFPPNFIYSPPDLFEMANVHCFKLADCYFYTELAKATIHEADAWDKEMFGKFIAALLCDVHEHCFTFENITQPEIQLATVTSIMNYWTAIFHKLAYFIDDDSFNLAFVQYIQIHFTYLRMLCKSNIDFIEKEEQFWLLLEKIPDKKINVLYLYGRLICQAQFPEIEELWNKVFYKRVTSILDSLIDCEETAKDRGEVDSTEIAASSDTPARILLKLFLQNKNVQVLQNKIVQERILPNLLGDSSLDKSFKKPSKPL